MVELLAPAGDFDCLKAAVFNGANAVYIGGKSFSARQFAGNFDRDQMVEAVRFCHSYGVKVYVTMNTLYRNDELGGAMEYAAFLYEIGVDALIIQDIGFLGLLRKQLPQFEIHGSTQMSVHNLDGVNLLYEMGIKRIVLARELSIKEIEYIAKNTNAEVEVFIHGAICICFSGQCLLSSMIGGRSGNRGRCAQPCRQQYRIDEGQRLHLLSPKELSTLEFVNEIAGAGAASLKIEGRMKKPEYVAGVVTSYRKALSGKLQPSDVDKVTQLFNRGGFTSFNLHKRQGKDMMSYERPKNWGTYLGKVVAASSKFASIKLEKVLNVGDGIENFDRNNGAIASKIWINRNETQRALPREVAEIYLEGAKIGDRIYKSLDAEIVREAEESFKGKDVLRLPIKGKFIAKKDRNISLALENANGVSISIEGDAPQTAIKTPTSREKVIEALSKTKDTPFYFENIDISMDENIAVPVSQLNLLRRNGITELMDIIQGRRESQKAQYKISRYEKNIIPKIVCMTGNIDSARAAIDAGCDMLFFGGDDFRISKGTFEETLKLGNDRTKILPWIPEILLEDYDRKSDELLKYKSYGITEALCGNIGIYSFLKKNKFDVYLSSGFNIFNSEACGTLKNAGVTLSKELNFKELRDLIEGTQNDTIVNVHGKTKVMVSRHCFIGSSMGNGREGCPNLCGSKIHVIKDKMGEEFEVVPDTHCMNHIYNSKILCTIEHLRDIINLNVNYLAVNFLDESYDEAYLTVSAYKSQLESAVNGNYNLTEEARRLLDKLKGRITKGHFNRGVD